MWQRSAARAAGVFTREAIKAGERFEQAPVLVIPVAQWDYIEQTLLFDYCYAWGG